ncbi:twin-arginine translocase TatA/TatE family subunit [Rhodanobacter sp. MP7CTX1]|uniref:twin-arginine translocase TatA/TatE family subunit n=1 Tax=Rhodanobacter sp. MP7CTX1 TaxID=2723084 RepID=UPI0016079FCB|nr:twin-arginine translocase TatA/TatE family subunit [Rhodanobacter sp. MP7CTX1]MBB6187612.1 sec-independent protein translocase protein TatA [Rhodanobacter sp. MP7CTX1]
MGLDSFWHWAILLVVVLVVFGTGKLSKIGPDIGNAVRGFKKAMQGDDEDVKRKEQEQLKADPPLAASATSSNATQQQHDSHEST